MAVLVLVVVGVGWTTICADVSTVIILDLECCWTMAAATCPPKADSWANTCQLLCHQGAILSLYQSSSNSLLSTLYLAG